MAPTRLDLTKYLVEQSKLSLLDKEISDKAFEYLCYVSYLSVEIEYIDFASKPPLTRT